MLGQDLHAIAVSSEGVLCYVMLWDGELGHELGCVEQNAATAFCSSYAYAAVLITMLRHLP